MAAQSTNQLVQNSACVDQCIPEGAKLSVQIYLLSLIAGVALNTNSLLQAATCVDSCIPPGMRESVIIYLLNQINSGGGSGTGCCPIAGHFAGNAPPNPPTNTSVGALAYDLDQPTKMWLWNPESLAWF
jgi:hypothetical protein